ncbi:MAG: TraB/VirB10 family protein [Geobacteraceae bacterium]|nr:TraB/VirB10 family protein [Geobacteraceae bacterium]
MKESIKQKWDALSPKTRKSIVLFCVATLLMSVVFVGWMRSRKSGIKIGPKEAAQQEIKLESGVIEKSKTADYELRLAQQQKQLEAIKQGKPIDDNLAGLDPRATNNFVAPIVAKNDPAPAEGATAAGAPPGTPEATTGKTADIPSGAKDGKKGAQDGDKGSAASVVLPPLPPPPLMSGSMQPGGIGSAQAAVPMPMPDQELGDILMVSATPGDNPKSLADAREGKKKGLMSVYLPPSFMAATLLSGLDAPTAGSAKGNPVPVLIRVKTPAVLPNEVKAQLAGCFVIADGKGNLSTERAELTLVSISCLDRKGGALIDQKIKGFVVDADGKIGLRGRVVAKFGSVVARSMLAGMLVGAGDAFKAQATTTAISPLGTTQAISGKDIGMAALGNGLSEGFKEIQKFYMELAHDSMPVIEIGATKRITLVVSEGLTLDIKKLKGFGANK